MSHHHSPAESKTWIQYWLSCVETVIVCSCLAFIFWAGHHYDWSIPGLGGSAHAHGGHGGHGDEHHETPAERRERQLEEAAHRLQEQQANDAAEIEQSDSGVAATNARHEHALAAANPVHETGEAAVTTAGSVAPSGDDEAPTAPVPGRKTPAEAQDRQPAGDPADGDAVTAQAMPTNPAATPAAPKTIEATEELFIDAEPVRLASAAAVEEAGLRVRLSQERPLDEFIEAFGEAVYNENRRAQLSARVPGVVWRVEKRLGEFIRKGEVLAIVDALDVGRAKSDLMSSCVAMHLKETTLSRLKDVSSSAPEVRIREMESEVNEARVQRFNAMQTLINLGLPVDFDFINEVDRTPEKLFDYLHFLGLPEKVTAGLDVARTTASLLPIFSPFDGVVTGRDVVVGEYVEPTKPQFEVVDVTKMWVRINIKKEVAQRVDIGNEVIFSSDLFPGEVYGKINWSSAEVDPKTRTVLMRADVENPLADQAEDQEAGQRMIRSNAFGNVRIRVRNKPTAVLIDSRAIQTHGRIQFVFVMGEDGLTFEARRVVTGVNTEGFGGRLTEIVEGLRSGERVVVQGGYGLKGEFLRQGEKRLQDRRLKEGKPAEGEKTTAFKPVFDERDY